MQKEVWIENHQKVRRITTTKAIGLGSSIISFFIYIYQNIIQKALPGELHPSEEAILFLFAATVVVATAAYYDWAMTMSKTYKNEGMHIKSNGASASTMAIFYNTMSRCFGNIVKLISLAAILMSIMLYIALSYIYGFSTAVTIVGLYLIAVLMTFPNICKTQARKITFVKQYHSGMSISEIDDLTRKIAISYKGGYINGYANPKTGRTESKHLPSLVKRAKKKITLWMSLYVVTYIITSIAYITFAENTVTIGHFIVSSNGYYVFVLLITLFMLLAQRYLYALITSGDAIKRRKICRVILGEEKRETAQAIIVICPVCQTV